MWSSILGRLHSGSKVDGYKVDKDGVLVFQSITGPKICLPEPQIPGILAQFHDALGHPGVGRTHNLLDQSFYRKNLPSIVTEYVRKCTRCGAVKRSPGAKEGRIAALRDIPPVAFHTISIDIILGLPPCKGFDAALAVYDLFSKMVLLQQCKSSLSATDAGHMLLQMVFRKGFCPRRIISDLDSKWLSDAWKAIHDGLGTTLSFSAAYHQQADPVERAIQTVETALRALCDKTTDWVSVLHLVEAGMNTVPASTTGHLPFDLLYTAYSGIRPMIDADDGSSSRSDLVDRARAVLKEAAASLRRAMESQAAHYNRRHAKPTEWHVGDLAWVDTRARPISSIKGKLADRFFGPFRVSRVVSNSVIELDLPAHVRLNRTFTVDQVKKAHVDNVQSPPPTEAEAQIADEPINGEPTNVRPISGAPQETSTRTSSRLAGRPKRDFAQEAGLRREAPQATSLTAASNTPADTDDKSLPKDLPPIPPGHAEKVIAFHSRVTSPAEKKMHITELELAGLTYALVQSQGYIDSSLPIYIVTDHLPLRSILRSSKALTFNARVEKYRMLIQTFLDRLVIVHRAGSKHSNVDALSRLPPGLSFFTGPQVGASIPPDVLGVKNKIDSGHPEDSKLPHS